MVRHIQVLVGTDYAKNWVATTQEFYPIYQGKSVHTYLNQHQQVLSLVTPEVDISPINVVVPFLGNPQHLVFSTAELWNPHPAWDELPHTDFGDFLPTIIRQTYSTGSWGVWLLDHPPQLSSYQRMVYASAEAGIQSFLAAVVQQEIEQISLENIVGMGEGLTPAGDDWLLGCLVALYLCGKGELAQQIATLACPLTTPLSAAYLQMAGKGAFSIQWHAFLKNPTPTTAQAIAQQGHTSGNSALAGFYMTWEKIKKAQG